MPARNLLLLQAPAYLFFAVFAYLAINMLAAFALNLEVCCETDTHPVSCFKDNISCPDGSHKVTPYTHCCEAAVARPFELTKLETVYAPRGGEGHDEQQDLLSRAQEADEEEPEL